MTDVPFSAVSGNAARPLRPSKTADRVDDLTE